MAVADNHTIERLTLHIEDAGDGWYVARIEEIPAAISQGRTSEEARKNVIAALHDLLDPRAHPVDMLDRLRIRAEDAGKRLRAMIAR